MKKKVIVSAALALSLTVLLGVPASADSTAMSVGGCTIGCASSWSGTSGVGVTTNGNSSITCKVDSTLTSKKGSKYNYASKSDSATASVTVKIATPSGYTPKLFSSDHTAVYSGKSYTRSTSVEK